MWKAQKSNHTYECTKGQASDQQSTYEITEVNTLFS